MVSTILTVIIIIFLLGLAFLLGHLSGFELCSKFDDDLLESQKEYFKSCLAKKDIELKIAVCEAKEEYLNELTEKYMLFDRSDLDQQSTPPTKKGRMLHR